MPSFKKIHSNEQKRQVITRWLGSFTVSAAVVVTAVVVINQTPVTGDILNVTAVGDEIVYRVAVTDPDGQIAEDTLRMEIQGSVEKYEIPLLVGESGGRQLIVGGRGTYDLKILADLGFGSQVLDYDSVTITGSLSGAFIDYELDSSIDLAADPYELDYLIETAYYDPEGLVASAIIDYTTEHEHQPTEAPRPRLAFEEGYYESVPVEGPTATTLLRGIMNNNLPVQMRLVVNLSGQAEPMILDEMSFYTPYRFMASIYAQDVGHDYAEFSVYQSGARRIDMEARVDLYQGEALVASKPVMIRHDDYDYYGTTVRFEGLAGLTEYSAVLTADYLHPDTQKETTSTVSTLFFATLPEFSYEVTSFIENETGYDMQVTVYDPFEIVTYISAYLITRDEEGAVDQYFYYDFATEPSGEATLYTATIAKPEALHYEIGIYLHKQYLGSYYEQEIYTYSV
jgi:hypothetical protein